MPLTYLLLALQVLESHLIKALYNKAVKSFRYDTMNPDRPTVALMAPTGVAAININGLPQYIQPYQFPKNLEILYPHEMSGHKRT